MPDSESQAKVLVNAPMGRVWSKRSTEGIKSHVSQVHAVDCLEVGCRRLSLAAETWEAVGVVITTSTLDA